MKFVILMQKNSGSPRERAINAVRTHPVIYFLQIKFVAYIPANLNRHSLCIWRAHLGRFRALPDGHRPYA